MSIITTYDGPLDYGTVVGTSSALPAGISTFYFVAWTGWLVPSVSGLYEIGVNVSGGANLTMCGVDMILNLSASGSANSTLAYTQSFSIYLTAGTYYDLECDWQFANSTAGSPPVSNPEFQLLWTPPLGSIQVIPAANLTSMSYTTTGNLWGQWAAGNSSSWYPNSAAPSYLPLAGGTLSGALILDAATPTTSVTGVAFGDTTGFGNGASAQTVYTTAKGTGTGPTTPQTVVGYLEININGVVAWVPYCH